MATMARQGQSLRDREDEAEALRYRLETVELQLEGVEHIGRELRTELGLVDAPASGAPQGGPFGEETGLGERAEIARRRLAVGLSELVGLRELLRQRRLAEAARAGSDSPDTESTQVEGTTEEAGIAAIPAGWPVAQSPTITSDYGWRIFRGRPTFHTGLDIGLPSGSEVLATAPGTVVGAGWQPGYGHSVLLQHAEGYNTLYAHLSGPLVRVGDIVPAGKAIGLSGSSGNSTGPHLHYEIWRDGVLVDPNEMSARRSVDDSAASR
jgi:murein DD-endopeptidase MepM/ murein hydrolase activator NlpD